MAVAIVALIAVVAWVAFGGLDEDSGGRAHVDPDTQSSDIDSDAQRGDVDQSSVISEAAALEIPLFDPFTTPALSDIDLERLAAAVATLDADAACPEAVSVESLEEVAEVVRISGGCLIVEYVPLEGRSIAEVRDGLAADPEVHAVGSPVLEVWPAQTGSYSDDPESEQQWHLERMQARELWVGWPQGANVTVAVIDSGVDADHRDLSHGVVGRQLGDYECHRSDDDGHGTHVAGIIAAAVGNDTDVAGIAPDANILPIRVLEGECWDIVTLTLAVDRAIRHEADVVNLSLVWQNQEEGFGGRQDPLETVIRVAMMQEIVVVAAAGNCGNPDGLQSYCGDVVDLALAPAIYPGVVAVAATNSVDDRSSFSTASDHVGIAAPGGGILSTWNNCSGSNQRCTATLSGTSQAAPIVSAVVAHMKARYPKASVGEIRRALYETAYNPDAPGGWTKEYGFGIVQPLRAIQRLGELFRSCQELSTVPKSVLYEVAVDIHADGDEKDDTRSKLIDRFDVWAIELLPEGDRCRMAHNAVQPAWSPDGVRLAFVHRESWEYAEDDNDIWVMEADGSNWKNLTGNDSAEFHPAWSPDGTRIAFVSHQGGNPDVWVVNADGSNRRNLTNHPAADTNPAWSPDGTQIAFASERDGGDFDIWVMDAGGSDARNLHDNNDYEDQPAWSPDGTLIAFVHNQDEFGLFDDDIWVMDTQGKNWRNLTDDPASDAEPAWSLDGTQIAFTSDRDGDDDIWVMNADGADPLNLTNTDDQDESHPSWSSAGLSKPVVPAELGDEPQPPVPIPERIAFVSYGAIHIANPDGSEPQRLTPDNSNQGDDFQGDFNLAWHDSDPSWSPDGTRMLFSSTRTGESEVFVMDPDGQNVQQLTMRTGGSSPNWSPDGTRIVFSRIGTYFTSKWRYNFDETENVFIMDADGTDIQRLTYSGGSSPSWSPDGRLIAFHRVVDGNYQVFVMAPDGSDGRQLTTSGGSDASWSPDGRQLVFNGEGEILVMNRDGTDIRQLTTFGSSNAHWSPDGQRIILESQHLYKEPITDIYAEFESHGILSMRIDGSEVVRISDGAYSPVWSPSEWRVRDATRQTLRLKQATIGDVHACGLETGGTVVCWGNNDLGQTSPPGLLFTSIDAGAFHTCGIDTGGAVLCWGNNYDGEAAPPPGTFTAVAAGFGHSCALRPDGSAICWGGNYEGESTPPAGSFVDIAAGIAYTCGLLSDGAINCWGDDSLGQSSPPSGGFITVSNGNAHSCALRTDNTAACWGSDDDGEASPPDGLFKTIAAGVGNSCAIRLDGRVECWGINYDGQASPPSGEVFEAIASGNGFSCGLTTEGEIRCWGRNYAGATEPPPELFSSRS